MKKLPTRVNRSHRSFLEFAAVQCAILGALAVTKPNLWESTAYSWVLDIVPLSVIGVMWLALAGSAVAIVKGVRNRGTAQLTPLIAWQTLYTIIQFAFAWSIFTLTWQGFYGAIAGSVQWGGLAYVSWLWLRQEQDQ